VMGMRASRPMGIALILQIYWPIAGRSTDANQGVWLLLL